MKSFRVFLEHIINIGFSNDVEKNHQLREKFRNQIFNILQKSYEKIGGYGGQGSGTPEEKYAIIDDIENSMIKAVSRNGQITAVNMYKNAHGRKSIASGTNMTDQGKRDWLKIKEEDNTQKRAWGEVSGAVEKLLNKMGYPKIAADKVNALIRKEIFPHIDNHHYDRLIGGEMHTKAAYGHPEID